MTFAAVVLLLQAGGGDEEAVALPSLVYLARHQLPDGSWGKAPVGCGCRFVPPPPEPEPALDEAARKEIAGLIARLDADEIPDREEAAARLLRLGKAAAPALAEASRTGGAEMRARAGDLHRRITHAGEGASLELTGFALYAFMLAGYSHLSKDTYHGFCFGDVIRNGFKWMLRMQREDGSFDAPHPLPNIAASLALAEIYGLTGSLTFKSAAQKALDKTGGLACPDPEVLAWKGLLLRSGHVADLDLPPERIQQFRAELEKAEGPVVRSALPHMFLWMDRKKDDEWKKRMEGVELKDPSPVALFFGGLSLVEDRKGERWQQWRDRADAILRAPREKGKTGCEQGSFEDRSGFAARIRRTALLTLGQEVRFGYFGPWLTR